MIHKNKRTHHSSQAKWQNPFHFYCLADSSTSGFNYNIEHTLLIKFARAGYNYIVPFFMSLQVRLHKRADRNYFEVIVFSILQCLLHNSTAGAFAFKGRWHLCMNKKEHVTI